MLPGHLPGEPCYVHFGGLRGGAAPSPFLLVLSGWFGFGTGPPPVISGTPRPRRAGGAAGAGAAGPTGASRAARC